MVNTPTFGHFDQQGHPCLKIHLCGVRHPPPGIEYEVMIDTGFSGFVQIPMAHAIALQLPLEGAQTLTLADGKTTTALTALVRATLGARGTDGVAVLSFADIFLVGMDFIFLVGMDFLRKFEQVLVIGKDYTGVMDESAITRE